MLGEARMAAVTHSTERQDGRFPRPPIVHVVQTRLDRGEKDGQNVITQECRNHVQACRRRLSQVPRCIVVVIDIIVFSFTVCVSAPFTDILTLSCAAHVRPQHGVGLVRSARLLLDRLGLLDRLVPFLKPHISQQQRHDPRHERPQGVPIKACLRKHCPELARLQRHVLILGILRRGNHVLDQIGEVVRRANLGRREFGDVVQAHTDNTPDGWVRVGGERKQRRDIPLQHSNTIQKARLVVERVV